MKILIFLFLFLFLSIGIGVANKKEKVVVKSDVCRNSVVASVDSSTETPLVNRQHIIFPDLFHLFE